LAGVGGGFGAEEVTMAYFAGKLLWVRIYLGCHSVRYEEGAGLAKYVAGPLRHLLTEAM